MWLCTGQRTLVLPQASDRPKLKAAWLEKVTEASRSAAATDIRSLGDRKKGRDFFPLQAAALGYSTVQNLQGNYPLQGTVKGQQRLWQSVLGACTGLSQSAPALLEAYSPQGFPVDTGMACIRACATVPNRH
jgi:hypothetical protein